MSQIHVPKYQRRWGGEHSGAEDSVPCSDGLVGMEVAVFPTGATGMGDIALERRYQADWSFFDT